MILIFLLCFCLVGCKTTQPQPPKDSTEEAVSALGTVTEGLSNQNISREDLKKLAVAVQKDPETKSAVRSINESLSVQKTGIKYCPRDGQRFDAAVENCPIHKVKLEIVE